MKKVVIVRYSEIHLKGRNRAFFEDLLQDNINFAVNGFGAVVEKIPGRYVVSGFLDKDLPRICNALDCVAGIFSYSVAHQIDTDLKQIEQLATSEASTLSGTFKVEVNRADKTFPLNSMQLASHIGGVILSSNPNLSVNVVSPEHRVYIDIRENKQTFVYTSSVLGMGGMPVGSSGKGLLLLSGGIDSPVAGYYMSKRGVKVTAVHFHSYPYTSELAKDKVERLAKLLVKYNGGSIGVYYVNMAKYQEAIHSSCDESYMITLLRRGMLRIAQRLCDDHHLDMIITGENLGQVASQTIESITVVENVTTNTPILRPLIAFDKSDIISVAKKINTFETSIVPYEDCCTVFLPDKPITRPKLAKVEREEEKFAYSELLDIAYSQIEYKEYK